MAYSTLIGDSQPVASKVVVAGLPVSLTTLAELSDADDPINNTELSGKKIGAMLAYEVDTGIVEVVVATGSEPTDPWTRLSAEGTVTNLTLTLAGDVADAAGITAQLNLVEDAVNSLLAGNSITPA